MCKNLSRRGLLILALVPFAFGVAVPAAPVHEPLMLRNQKLEPMTQFTTAVELKGQEPARVIVSGDNGRHLGLYVLDAFGNCVAWDDNGGKVRDDSGVVFIPPANGTYTIHVHSFASQSNVFRLVVR